MFALLQAIILGIIEGLTEFLPVSSTGHLIVAERLLDFNDTKEVFTVVIQIGAILAVIWYFRKDLAERLEGLARREQQAINFWKILAIGTVPAGIIGLLLDNHMEKITTPLVVAIALIIGGVILWLVDRAPVIKRDINPAIDKISVKQATLVGLAQCVAIIPGVSRSGATIVGGLSAGLDRPTATALSFYLSIPVLVLASAYKLVKYGDTLDTIPGGWGSLLVGMFFAFLTALAAVSWLLKYVSRHNFRPFAYYRILAGVAILLWLAL